MKSSVSDATYKWYLLVLAAFSCALVAAGPAMSMTVLFKEISTELKLNVVQVGMVWGLGSLPSIFTALLMGALADRLGPRRMLIGGTILTGLAGALRGVAPDFFWLAVSMVIFGGLNPLVILAAYKTCGNWFPPQKLGLAAGVLSMGMALGFSLSSIFSATLLSPWLGGWRQVFYFYGAISVIFCVLWVFTRHAPAGHEQAKGGAAGMSIRRSALHVMKIRDVWLLGLTVFCVGGAVQGLFGYLPLHLRIVGWPGPQADGALGMFHTMSLIAVLPISFLSDRLASRKIILIGAVVMTTLGVGLLSFADGWLVWVAVMLAGAASDGFMASYMTMVIETDGVGPVYAGTATGFTSVVSNIGRLIAPPIGNSLVPLAPAAPFAFWAALAVLGLVCISGMSKRSKAPTVSPFAPVPVDSREG